jgi:hypothetical protein
MLFIIGNKITTLGMASNGVTVHSKLDAWGRAIAQAVSLWLPTAAARVQTQV